MRYVGEALKISIYMFVELSDDDCIRCCTFLVSTYCIVVYPYIAVENAVRFFRRHHELHLVLS